MSQNDKVNPGRQELISVIIPVYNAEQYIKRCVHSILESTYQNIEVICIDDGSTDDSGKVLSDLLSEDDRLILLNNNKKGVSSARNMGLSIAKGKYICFVDSDDWIDRRMIGTLIKAAEQYQVPIAACRSNQLTEENAEKMTPDDGDLKEQLLGINDVLYNHLLRTRVWAKIYNKSFIGKTVFPEDISNGEDVIFNLLLFAKGDNLRILYVDCPLYNYFIHEGSLVRSADNKSRLAKSYWSLKHYKEFSDKRLQGLLIEEGIKGFLSNRYMSNAQGMDYAFQKRCKKVRKAFSRCLSEEKGMFSFRKKMIYGILLRSNGIYRLFRIAKDPSLIQMERARRS